MDITAIFIGLYLGILAILALILYFEVKGRDTRPLRVVRVDQITIEQGWKEGQE